MKTSEMRRKNSEIAKERISEICINSNLNIKKYKLKIVKQDKGFIIPKLSKLELNYLDNKYKKILSENNFSNITDMLNKGYMFYLELIENKNT